MTSFLCDCESHKIFVGKTKFGFQYFIVDYEHYRVHENGICEEPVYYGNKVTSWNECPVPMLLTAFLLKRLVAPEIPVAPAAPVANVASAASAASVASVAHVTPLAFVALVAFVAFVAFVAPVAPAAPAAPVV
jgi:hypothetical protein